MKHIYIIIVLLLAVPAEGARLHPESYYQKSWCDAHGGQTEYVLDDNSRVDCLTDTHAIEFDFASKWAESVGQALYYGSETNRTPGIVIILESGGRNDKYLMRLTTILQRTDWIKLWVCNEGEICK